MDAMKQHKATNILIALILSSKLSPLNFSSQYFSKTTNNGIPKYINSPTDAPNPSLAEFPFLNNLK
jgi:hypothetical protein